MKKIGLIMVMLAIAAGLQAQVGLAVNPQVGLIGVRTSQEPRAGIRTNNKIGFLGGVDLRVGNRFYLQPGAFLTTSKTVYEFDDSLFVNEEEIARTSFKLKALAGFKVVDGEHFNLRLAAGPTYDFLIGLNGEDNTVFEEDEFKNGTFNLDAAIGMDIYILTLEVGYSYGFSNVYQSGGGFNSDAKYQGVYATVGIAFGLTEPN
ncbi:MAG: outer membrane beta-barrel protein [Bacteroidetes bacterium]|nr:outer membrane beta-barrel protein [Bacteroidota bacterium]